MSQLKPYINSGSDGVYFPVVQSNPRYDMYNRGILPDRISAKYRHKQKQAKVVHPNIDKVGSAILNPKGTPNPASMIGAGKNKSKVRNSIVPGYQSKHIAFINEVGMAAKKPKANKATLAPIGSKSVAREPVTQSKLSKRYQK